MNPPASPARTIRPDAPTQHEPPVDLADFRRRWREIVQARAQARKDAEESGIAASEAEHDYLKRRAIRIAHHRKEGASWDAATKLAEGDETVVEHRQERDNQRVFQKAAWAKWEELGDNKTMLNRESQMSEGIEA